jgi:hypothetical protein
MIMCGGLKSKRTGARLQAALWKARGLYTLQRQLMPCTCMWSASSFIIACCSPHTIMPSQCVKVYTLCKCMYTLISPRCSRGCVGTWVGVAACKLRLLLVGHAHLGSWEPQAVVHYTTITWCACYLQGVCRMMLFYVHACLCVDVLCRALTIVSHACMQVLSVVFQGCVIAQPLLPLHAHVCFAKDNIFPPASPQQRALAPTPVSQRMF